ncbi:MAG: phosphatase PAP2 family protein [Acidimicrobiia bacterium]|nr:phosphatase PAP2 family protein [Acidimicrobiia bacterium]
MTGQFQPATPPRVTRPREHEMLAEHRWALVASLVLYLAVGALFVLMAFPSGEKYVQSVDDWWYDSIDVIRVGAVTALAHVLNVLGSTWVTVPIRVVTAGWLARIGRIEALTTWILTIVASEAMIWILKTAYRRERPPDGLVETTSFSFPSGHAIAGTVTAIALVIVLVPAGRRRRRWEVIAGLFAFTMGMSRVYLNAHWLSDVVAGTVLAAAFAIGIAALVHEVGDAAHRRRVERDLEEADGSK